MTLRLISYSGLQLPTEVDIVHCKGHLTLQREINVQSKLLSRPPLKQPHDRELSSLPRCHFLSSPIRRKKGVGSPKGFPLRLIQMVHL